MKKLTFILINQTLSTTPKITPKHAMHLIRLLITGTEVLEGKGINTYREKEREFLLDIRKGKYSYNDWQQKTLLFPINPIISV